MKFIRKLPETDPKLSEKLCENGWKKLKEPRNTTSAILFSLPLMFLLGGISLFFSYLLDPSLFLFLGRDTLRFTIRLNGITMINIAFLFVFLALHEFLHALFIPGFSKSDQVFWGFNGLFAFVFTTQPIKRERFLLISMMPYLLLSIALPVLLHLFHLLNGYLAFLCLFNAMGSSVDILNSGLVLFQVPKGQDIISNGSQTFYTTTK